MQDDEEEVRMEELFETTSDASVGVLVRCVREGSKLRMRIGNTQLLSSLSFLASPHPFTSTVTPGYDPSFNVQFPLNVREEGASFVVDEVRQEAGFYRAMGTILRYVD